MTNYTLAGYSSFGGVYLTPAGPTDVTVIAVAICVVLIVVAIIVAMVIAVVVFCKKWSKYRYVCANPLHPSMTVHVCQVLICSSRAGCALCWVCPVLGVHCTGCALYWVCTVLGVHCPGCALYWVCTVLGVHCPGCALCWYTPQCCVHCLLCSLLAVQARLFSAQPSV